MILQIRPYFAIKYQIDQKLDKHVSLSIFNKSNHSNIYFKIVQY